MSLENERENSTTIQGKMQGKKSVRRRRISWLGNLRGWYDCSSRELVRAAVSRIRIDNDDGQEKMAFKKDEKRTAVSDNRERK